MFPIVPYEDYLPSPELFQTVYHFDGGSFCQLDSLALSDLWSAKKRFRESVSSRCERGGHSRVLVPFDLSKLLRRTEGGRPVGILTWL